MEYVAERPDGAIVSVVGDEYSIGVGYDDEDLKRQRERICLRFSSKTIPKIPLFEYLDRYTPPVRVVLMGEFENIMMFGRRCY